MKRYLRWIFGAAILAACLAYPLAYGIDTKGEAAVVIVGALLSPLVAFGSDVYGAVRVALPWGGAAQFGDDDECDHGGRS